MMKKIVSLMLTVSMVFVLCGFGGNKEETADALETSKTPNQLAYEISKDAYDDIALAYDMLSIISSDIYEAWRISIYEASDINDKVRKNKTPDDAALIIASELSLSKEEFYKGLKTTYLREHDFLISEDFYELLPEEVKKRLDNIIKTAEEDQDFVLYDAINNKKLFSYCVSAVIDAYTDNGAFETVEGLLSDAKQQMKKMSIQYSDYEHYPNLKGFFTNTNALLDFCKSPEGSFEQLKETINTYKNDARKFRNDLDFIFED